MDNRELQKIGRSINAFGNTMGYLELEKIVLSINAFLPPQELHFKRVNGLVSLLFCSGVFLLVLVLAFHFRREFEIWLAIISFLLFALYCFVKRSRQCFSDAKEFGLVRIFFFSAANKGARTTYFRYTGTNNTGNRKSKYIFYSGLEKLFYILPVPADAKILEDVLQQKWKDSHIPRDVSIFALCVEIDSSFGKEFFFLHEDPSQDPNFRFTEDQIRKLEAIRKKAENDIANDPIFRLTPEQERRIREFSELH